MNESVTNKHLLITMLIIGVITIGILVSPRYSTRTTAYTYGTTLGATAYQDGYYAPGAQLHFGQNQAYVANLVKSYGGYSADSYSGSTGSTTTTYYYSSDSSNSSTTTQQWYQDGCAPYNTYSTTTSLLCTY